MSSDGLLRRLLLVLFLLSALQAALNASELPALSAVWFGLDGEARWYVETWRFMWVHVGAAAAVATAFWVLPERLVAHDDAGGGIPARAAAPRGTEPRAAVLRRWHWLGIVSLLVLTAAAQLWYDANRTTIPRLALGRLAVLGGGYAAFVATWALLHARARRTAHAQPALRAPRRR